MDPTAATDPALDFQGRSFCFTGKLAELKRTRAEREARARGGLTSKVVNGELDYLVVGSIPATGWKHGSYGNKIEKARRLRADGAGPRLVSESAFMDALATTAPTNSGAIDTKVIVATCRFTAPDRMSFDRAGLEHRLGRLSREHGCSVRVRTCYVRSMYELFGETYGIDSPDDHLLFEVRVVRQFQLDDQTEDWLRFLSGSFGGLDGVDGPMRWFERIEGSTDYIRLLREVPEDLRIPEL